MGEGETNALNSITQGEWTRWFGRGRCSGARLRVQRLGSPGLYAVGSGCTGQLYRGDVLACGF
jgi:hypothetical protein